MNYKFGLPVEIIFKCGAVKNINKVIKDNLYDLYYLDENKDYKFNLFGQDIVKSGRYLMNHGLTVKLEGDYASLVLYIKEV